MRLSSHGSGNRWLFVAGTLAELIAGVAFIAWSIRLTIQAVAEDRLWWLGYTVLLLGVVLLAHAGYLAARRSIDARLRVLYEALLESTPPTG
jgi:uncharacterized membrane protein YhaH (DUF805 family)